ncbi:nuclease-related domain-containing protein [Robiginitalea sp. IMCC43444]|uniref:nuclease-related domain-containing protein n=1 Tax=Robiginitalea sp. IMCC43444 TaxID=3459121 RepID=UPI004041872E
MARVFGKIESLKRIRERLNQEGITRFNSVKDLNRFTLRYERYQEELLFNIEQDYADSLQKAIERVEDLEKRLDNEKADKASKFTERLDRLNTKSEHLRNKTASNAVLELADWYYLQLILGLKFILTRRHNSILRQRTKHTEAELDKARKHLYWLQANEHNLISVRYRKESRQLERTRALVSELNPLVAGAIGENRVAKELSKLPEDCVLFNDFSLHFDPPIYNKKTGDRIFSIQIDHLLVTHAGIFVIETKNWSKKSLANLDLRSPVDQIKRVSYALFVLLNSHKSGGNLSFDSHHWGEKQVPIKSLIVMINHKPKEKFKHVKVKTLDELNDYIKHFDALFNEDEVYKIASHLKWLQA